MGLLKAGLGAAGGVMADQWKEFIYCESMPADVLACKGVKRTGVVDYILRRGHKGLIPAEKIGRDLRIRNGDKGHIRLLGFDGCRRRGGCRRAVRRIEEREEQRKDLH